MSTSLLEKLHAQLSPFYADNLPAEIHYRTPDGKPVSKPLTEATVDEVAFMIQALGEESSRILRRRSSLEELYITARRRGAVGAARLTDLIEEKTK